MQQVTHTYSKAQWADKDTRVAAIQEARETAKLISGKVIIKVKDGRTSTKMFEIAYIEQRNGFSINRRAYPDE